MNPYARQAPEPGPLVPSESSGALYFADLIGSKSIYRVKVKGGVGVTLPQPVQIPARPAGRCGGDGGTERIDGDR